MLSLIVADSVEGYLCDPALFFLAHARLRRKFERLIGFEHPNRLLMSNVRLWGLKLVGMADQLVVALPCHATESFSIE